jgi:hypothetical protein
MNQTSSSELQSIIHTYLSQSDRRDTRSDPKDFSLKYAGRSRSFENAVIKPVETEYSLVVTRTIRRNPQPKKRITETAMPPSSAFRRKKSNTESDADVLNGVTVSIDVMMQCISRAVWYELKANEDEIGIVVDAFTEGYNCDVPSMCYIADFFTRIFKKKNLSMECAVTAAAYVDKLKKISNVKLHRTNWKRICFISVLEADKVLRDKLVWNEDYKDIIPEIDLELLRRVERAFLKYIEFSLNLTQSEYASYLFDLLSLRSQDMESGGGEKDSDTDSSTVDI